MLRHPAYIGSLLIFAGLGLALGNWLSLLACLTLPAVGYLSGSRARRPSCGSASTAPTTTTPSARIG